MIRCCTCKRLKPDDEYYWKNKAQTARQEYCRDCKSEYNRTWYQKNKERHKAQVAIVRQKRADYFYKIVNELKSVPCPDCNRNYPPVCMDFDHIGDDKMYDISRMIGFGPGKVLDEIAKCEVVCSNCHRIRTAARRPCGVVDSAR